MTSFLLKSASYECPGLHGPGSKQRIERRTFQDFMDNPDETERLLIPLFQRRYCWDERRIRDWWKDAIQGKRDHFGIHNSGNIVLKKSKIDDDAWIVIDGQQRLTTTSLMVAAIRDATEGIESLQEEKARKAKLIERQNRILYRDLKSFETFVERNRQSSYIRIPNGEDVAFSKLLPSFSDRQSYFNCILEGYLTIQTDDEDDSTPQVRAKRIFDQETRKWLHSRELSTNDDSVSQLDHLEMLTDMALKKMGFTLVDIENEIHMPQVFLWLQEKSLIGEAAILYNPTPGIAFKACDMIRNQVLSSVMEESLAFQEEFYRKEWLFPLESKFNSTDEFSLAIDEYINGKLDSSLYEERLKETSKGAPESSDKPSAASSKPLQMEVVDTDVLKTVTMEFLKELKSIIREEKYKTKVR